MSCYTWGKADSGQLGLGNTTTKDVLNPTSIEGIKGRVANVSCGEKHCLAVNELGEVFAWGRGREGQCGNGKRELFLSLPTKVKSLETERIIKVCCGAQHCVVVTQCGEIYQWGLLHRFSENENSFGTAVEMPGMRRSENWEEKRKIMLERSIRQYYSGDQGGEIESLSEDVSKFSNFLPYVQTSPLLVRELRRVKIVDVAAGYSFTIAVSDQGHLYGWGFNEKRQLGLGHRFNQDKPQLIRSLADSGIRVIQVACGQQHVLAVTDDGKIYSWGLGVLGQLGHGDTRDIGHPKLVEALSGRKVLRAACGSNHSLVLTDDGLFSWGSAEYGQQASENGHMDWGVAEKHTYGERRYYYAVPRPILEDFFGGNSVVNIACGSLHNMAVTESGNCYTWGWGIHGALGHGDRNSLPIPHGIGTLRGEKIKHVSGSAYSSIAVTSGGSTTFAFDFKQLINSELFSDLTFEVQGRKIFAHKVIIFARCPTLRLEWYRTHSTETTDSMVLEEVEYYIFLSFLRYLYTDHLSIPAYHSPKVAALASKYGLPRLAALCARILRNSHSADLSEGIPPSTFVTDLEKVVGQSEESDVRLLLGSDEKMVIYGHRAILAARSDYFRTIFSGNFFEKGQNCVTLPDLEWHTCLEMLRFIYVNEIDEKSENLADLLIASDRFLLDDLRLILEKHLENILDVDTVGPLLLLSESSRAPKLRKACVNLLSCNQHLLHNMPELKLVTMINPHIVQHIYYTARSEGH